ncbi:MAG: Hsp70 family protein [Candidatus Limiplasma sp.]|nr:Hsp70 family protein [Candidatus Limiplasma sp.]
MKYIGFDIGDGESAVALYEHGSSIEPILLPIHGSKSILSAVGTMNGDIVIGEQAYTSALAENLSVRFKSRFTDDPNSYDTIVRFVQGVQHALRDAGVLQEDVRFVVGCPAGWNAAARARYRDLLVRGGIHQPQVISESRAAFLYAKYAKTIALDVDLLSQSALVVDMGSSTLDFAYIVDGRETGVGTFGDAHLGGGLIDEELLRRALSRSRDRDAIVRVFQSSRSWYSYCEIEARKVKEQYFTLVAQDAKASVKKQLRLYYDGTQKLQLTMDALEAEEIIHQPLASLDGQSFVQALAASLINAKRLTEDHPPKLLLLTGGASRMPFVQAMCRETFANAVVVVCPEPEYSIAKGLAYAGWVDENLRAFRKAIQEEVTDTRVQHIARSALPELIPSVVNTLLDLTLAEAAIPTANAWRSGDIATLREMNAQMQRRIDRVLSSNLAEAALAPVFTLWMKSLTDSLQAMIDPICDRYHVPREEMRLSLTQTGDSATVRIGAKEMIGFPLMGTMVGVVISVVGALLGGGGGIALIATGPLGMLAGAVVGALVTVFGWPAVTQALLNAQLPRAFRLLNVEKRLRSESTRRALREALNKELANEEGAFAQGVVTSFTAAFQRYLFRIAQAAEIPIQ